MTTPNLDGLASSLGGSGRTDVDLIARYLARRDGPEPGSPGQSPADVLVLCGSAVLSSIDVAAAIVAHGSARRILVSGGIGHSTNLLRLAVGRHPHYGDVPTSGRSEAAIITDVLLRHAGVEPGLVTTEEESTNCGENARLSVAALDRAPAPVRSILVVQDPTMQRRTHASFLRSLAGRPDVRLRSHAPFVPVLPDPLGADVLDADGAPVWAVERFVSLVVGEVARLRDNVDGYGPRGANYFDHVDVPDEVLAAFERLRRLPSVSARRVGQP